LKNTYCIETRSDELIEMKPIVVFYLNKESKAE